MRINICLTALLTSVLLTGVSGCGLKGDLYLSESAKVDETPAAETELGKQPEEQGIIEPAVTEQPGGSGAGLVAEDSAQAAPDDAGAESAVSDEDENEDEDQQPEAAAPSP